MKNVDPSLVNRTPWRPYHVALGFTSFTENSCQTLSMEEFMACSRELSNNGATPDMIRKLILSCRIATQAIARAMQTDDERS